MSLDQSDILEIQKLLNENQAAKAEPLARAAATREPTNAIAWFLLASVMRALGQRENAMAALQKALLIQPFHPAYHTFQAELHLDSNRVPAAEEALKRALSAKSDFIPALSLLGVIYMDSGRAAEAIAPLQQCLRLKPESAQHANNLGAALLAVGRDADAEASFAHAVRNDPDYFTARYNLVRAQVKRGADQDAAAHLQVLLAQQPQNQECLLLVGNLCHRNGDFATAAEYLRRAAQIQPVNPPVVNALAEFCWEQGDTAAAIDLYTVSAEADPANIRAALGRHLSLPMVTDTVEGMLSARASYRVGLQRLRQLLPILEQRPAAKALSELQWTNFLLAYQGEDDRPLQEEYAQIAGHLIRKALPRHTQLRASIPHKQRQKPRVGFISSHFYTCTAGRYFASWITDLPKDKYEIIVYDGSAIHDTLSARIHSAADIVRNVYSANLEKLAEQIAEDQLEVLIYPELGMNPHIFPLGTLRLAKTQVAGWGHPVTTGLQEIDYFLSSEAMEPPEAGSHYSEHLQLLPGLGTNYPAPKLNVQAPSRGELNLPAQGTLYLIPQSLYKIHPDNDAILAEVMRLDPAGTLIMFATERHKVATTVFVKRLQAALERAGVDPQGRVCMLPQTNHENYLAINQHCNVMIDTLHWSGGNTTLDALAVGLPVLTTEGRFMRGRQSAAMLRMTGVPELIVEDPGQLAQRAVALANDTRALNEMRQRILQGHPGLFGQIAPVAALDEFISSLIH